VTDSREEAHQQKNEDNSVHKVIECNLKCPQQQVLHKKEQASVVCEVARVQEYTMLSETSQM